MNSLRVRLSILLLGVLVVALLALSTQAARKAEALLQPEIERKAATVADSASRLVERALQIGIPGDRLYGLDHYLQRIVESNPDLAFIELRAMDGHRLYGSHAGPTEAMNRATTISREVQGGKGATIVVGLDPAFAHQVVSSLWIDLAIVIFVTAVVALELIYLGFGIGLYGAIEGVENRLRLIRRGDLRLHLPVDAQSDFGGMARKLDIRLDAIHAAYASLRQRISENRDQAAQHTMELLRDRFGLGERIASAPARAIAVRAPLFVFMLAEEFTRPFLPGHIRTLTVPVSGLSPEFVTSLPMVAFLVVVAISQPILGGVTERLGRRRGLMTGALLGLIGYAFSALADGLGALTLARAVSGLGFAFVFVSAQGFVIDSTDPRQRSSGMAMFISAILVAGLCGPPIGGILADRLGIPGAFIAAAVFAAISLALAYACMPAQERTKAAGPAIRWRDFGRVMTSPSLAALLFLCALPAKVILAAFCFFLVPLQMEELGATQSATGRMLMIYPAAMVLLVPTFASLADRWSMRAAFVAGGGVVAGVSAFVILAGSADLPIIALMLVGLGIGQAISIAALSALVGEFGSTLPDVSESSVYGMFRLVERSGNALGPLIGGALLGAFGFASTVMIIGGSIMLGALVFGATALSRAATLQIPPARG